MSAWLFPSLLLVLLAAQPPAAQAAAPDKPLQIAVVNQVHFHLEVVAGAMHVTKQMTSAPVTVYLPAKVLKTNWYGFVNWLGGREGFIWKEGKEYDGKTTYDLVWFITPERHIPWVITIAEQMKPKVAMFMVHNGHLPDSDFKALRTLSGKMPLLTLSPHVSKNITGKTGDVPPEWILPIYPYTPAMLCQLSDLQVRPPTAAAWLCRTPMHTILFATRIGTLLDGTAHIHVVNASPLIFCGLAWSWQRTAACMGRSFKRQQQQLLQQGVR